MFLVSHVCDMLFIYQLGPVAWLWAWKGGGGTQSLQALRPTLSQNVAAAAAAAATSTTIQCLWYVPDILHPDLSLTGNRHSVGYQSQTAQPPL